MLEMQLKKTYDINTSLDNDTRVWIRFLGKIDDLSTSWSRKPLQVAWKKFDLFVLGEITFFRQTFGIELVNEYSEPWFRIWGDKGSQQWNAEEIDFESIEARDKFIETLKKHGYVRW